MPHTKALFLDRDGVINQDRQYVYRREDFEFVEGIFELVAAARQKGYKIIIVTNQSGIGRGLYSENDFHTLMLWLKNELPFDGLYFCPHHPDAAQGEYRRVCADRKPAPGMILRAARDHDLDLGRSFLIGDKETDIAAAQAAGIGTSILLGTADSAANYVVQTLKQAQALL